jgi:hypothetical protein
MNFEIPEWVKYEIAKRWEKLELREKINNHATTVLTVSTVSVVSLVVLVIWASLGPRKPVVMDDFKKEWYYNLSTGQLFRAKTGQLPPIATPGQQEGSEAMGVRAYVMSYKSEPQMSDIFVAYLEKFAPESKAEIQQLLKGDAEQSKQAVRLWNKSRLIKRPEDPNWLEASSSEGKLLISEFFAPDDAGRIPTYCAPDQVPKED